jgi:type II secretory pathway predicted ATPase ExeA
MFQHYYKLREQPFGVTPDPRYLYLSPTHREALASLVYGIEARRGFIALIAKPGMGKTTLLFKLLQGLESTAKTVLIFQSQCTPRDFLRSLLSEVGIADIDDDFAQMQSKLNELLLRESRAGKGVVVIVDEAQNLNPSVLEVLRMLSNFETPREKLMQIILVGQPQLANNLLAPNLQQLRQRISILARLTPFTPEETNQYIDHRLEVAGYNFEEPLFTPRARAMIAEHSAGIPRNISNLCFHALSLGCALKQKTINKDVILEVLGDLNFESPDAPQASPVLSEKSVPQSVRQSASDSAKGSAARHWLSRSAVAGALLIASSQPILDAGGNAAKVSASEANAPAAVASGALVRPAESAIPVVSRDPNSASIVPTSDMHSINGNRSASQTMKQQSHAIPSAEIRPAEARAVRVAQGETIYGICMEHFGKFSSETVKEIFKLNSWLVDPAALQPGDVILIPSARKVEGRGRSADERSPMVAP